MLLRLVGDSVLSYKAWNRNGAPKWRGPAFGDGEASASNFQGGAVQRAEEGGHAGRGGSGLQSRTGGVRHFGRHAPGAG